MTKLALAAVAASMMLAGCNSGADPDEVIATIRQTEQVQLDAIAAKDLVGIARPYTDDATLIRPDGTVIEGGGAIADAYGDLLDDPNFSIAVEPQDGWASTAQDLAVVTSNVALTTSDAAGEPQTTNMISQTVWTRANGSTWKIASAHNAPGAPAEAPMR